MAVREAIGKGADGPAFPSSPQDRERGKFRPSTVVRQTVVAVGGDDGLAVTRSTDELLADILAQMKIQNAHLALITGEEELDASDY